MKNTKVKKLWLIFISTIILVITGNALASFAVTSSELKNQQQQNQEKINEAKQEQHQIFREALAEDVCYTEFYQQILEDSGFKSKHDLITYLKSQNNFLRMDHILILLEMYNININIWPDNQINGLKWHKLPSTTTI